MLPDVGSTGRGGNQNGQNPGSVGDAMLHTGNEKWRPTGEAAKEWDRQHPVERVKWQS